MRTHNLIAAVVLATAAILASTAFIVSHLADGGDASYSLVGALYADNATPLNLVAPNQAEAQRPLLRLAVAPVDDGTDFSLNA